MMSGSTISEPRAGTRNHFLVLCLISVTLIVLLRTAWVSDDAYITMRTADNFVHGYGLVYNIGERVQTYTHPLWLFCLAGLYAITSNAYYTLVILSLILTLIGVVILLQHLAKTPAKALLAVTAFLFSKAFVDFSSSGLENPLSHLVVIVFFGYYLTGETSHRRLFLLALLAALGALTRLDLILVFLPALLLTLLEFRTCTAGQRVRAGFVLISGFLPLIAWLAFSLFYYGFFMPNTAYAKLNTGIPQTLLYQQGIGYFLSSLSLDPVTLLVTALGLAAAVLSRNSRQLAIAAGVVLYCGYIVYIGGDFMNGRFFTVPLLCAVILLCMSDVTTDFRSLLLPLSIVLIVGFTSPYPPVFSTENYGQTRDAIDVRGVADERAYYYPTTGLLRACRNCLEPNHEWAALGLAARNDTNSVEVVPSSGFFGFFAGPDKHIVDTYALLDPFLARLALRDVANWRIGHFVRQVPSGYIETLESGENRIKNPQLAEFYGHLALITRGDLINLRRFIEIYRMNTGQYNYLLVNSERP